MTTYEQILELFPLISYEEERAQVGYMTLEREVERRELAKGVTYIKRRYLRGDGRGVDVYLAAVAPDAQAQLAVSACPLRTIKYVKQHAADFDGKVLFAMNASYFHFFNNGDHTPYSIQVMHGVTMAEPGKDKPQYSHFFLAVDKQGKPFISNAQEYYERWQGKLSYAVGGGIQVIKDGEIRLHSNNVSGPRTAVGIAKDGTAVLLCCDGRSQVSAGLSMADLIDIYTHLEWEISDLLNLDGGGSTTVVLPDEQGGFYVDNVPSGPPAADLPQVEPHGDTQARPVADAVLIVAK